MERESLTPTLSIPWRGRNTKTRKKKNVESNNDSLRRKSPSPHSGEGRGEVDCCIAFIASPSPLHKMEREEYKNPKEKKC